jgi:hypothetical protein
MQWREGCLSIHTTTFKVRRTRCVPTNRYVTGIVESIDEGPYDENIHTGLFELF